MPELKLKDGDFVFETALQGPVHAAAGFGIDLASAASVFRADRACAVIADEVKEVSGVEEVLRVEISDDLREVTIALKPVGAAPIALTYGWEPGMGVTGLLRSVPIV